MHSGLANSKFNVQFVNKICTIVVFIYIFTLYQLYFNYAAFYII